MDLCQRLRRKGHTLKSDSGMRSVHMGDPKTLRAIFWGELWRGRDNLRVSFRGPMALRDLPSVAIPVTMLVLLAQAVARAPDDAVERASTVGHSFPHVVGLLLPRLSTLRALRMLRRPSAAEGRWTSFGPGWLRPPTTSAGRCRW